MKKLSSEQYFNRGYALRECADHLMLEWTDDPEQYKEGKVISDRLITMAEAEYAKGFKRQDEENIEAMIKRIIK